MSSLVEQIINDLESEHEALGSVLDRMTPEQWDIPSHAPGWKTRHQVAHLAAFDRAAEAAIRGPGEWARFRAGMGPTFEADYCKAADALPAAGVLQEWRAASSGLISASRQNLVEGGDGRLPWFGPDMSPASFLTARLMECWSHGLDVIDVVGIPRPDTDRLFHVATIAFRARPYSYTNRGMTVPSDAVHVVLTAPSGATWEFGEPNDANVIRGSAAEFCRVLTRRRHVADTNLQVTGPLAREWMEIGQAFAGHPGEGRQPGQFPREASA
ncbi:MAG TPA: TIGR03084 family metal-binding protein [Tepidiformaceae bacterium]|nr:TIGR03084 family metal-binding protein [Tepidiformaceae bacterium]